MHAIHVRILFDRTPKGKAGLWSLQIAVPSVHLESDCNWDNPAEKSGNQRWSGVSRRQKTNVLPLNLVVVVGDEPAFEARVPEIVHVCVYASGGACVHEWGWEGGLHLRGAGPWPLGLALVLRGKRSPPAPLSWQLELHAYASQSAVVHAHADARRTVET